VAFQRRKPAAIGAKPTIPANRTGAGAIDSTGPKGERWILEIRFDGCRVRVPWRTSRVFTRRGNDQAKRFKRIADLGAAHRPGSTMGRWCHPRMAPPFFDAAKPAEVGGPSALKCKTARQPHAHLTTQVGGGEGSNPPARRRLRGHNQRKSDAAARSGTDSTEAIQRAFS
jgi:hypothetical protein